MTAARRPQCTITRCSKAADVFAEVVRHKERPKRKEATCPPSKLGFRGGTANLCNRHLAFVCKSRDSGWSVVVVPYLANGGLRKVAPKPGCEPKYSLVCQATDSEIEHVMARWAGCYDEWRACAGMRSRHFIRDVVEKSGVPVDVRQRRWDYGMPGMSGIRYKVYTTDKIELKAAVRARLLKFISELDGTSNKRSR